MVYLENDHIKAEFSAKGAELQYLKSKDNNENYLWSGDKEYWGKFSPVLFPIVGGLKESTFLYQGRPYQLSRHGFARDQQFSVQAISASEVLFILEHSADTLSIFPFEFHLGIRYKIEENKLSCSYEVTNPNAQEKLIFSIGGHPAFAVKTYSNLSYSDYFLEFDNDEELIYHKIDNDLIADETVVMPLKNRRLELMYELFYEDALVFKSLKSSKISLLNHKNNNGLHFQFSDFPYFGIWAAKNADFICLEPWCGIADQVGHNQQLAEKEGMMTLAPLEEWERTWSVSIF